MPPPVALCTTRHHLPRQTSLEYTYYFCMCCGKKFFSLKGAPALETMSKRKTDGATAVLESYTADLYALRGDPKKIKRAKGVERQYPLKCGKCGVQIAYRCAALRSGSPVRAWVARALLTPMCATTCLAAAQACAVEQGNQVHVRASRRAVEGPQQAGPRW